MPHVENISCQFRLESILHCAQPLSHLPLKVNRTTWCFCGDCTGGLRLFFTSNSGVSVTYLTQPKHAVEIMATIECM